MPELPEVEIISRYLSSKIVGLSFIDAIIYRRDLRVHIPDNLEHLVVGKSVCSVCRVAKYVIVDLDSGHMLVFHFGMSGRILHTNKYMPQKHDHAVFKLCDGFVLIYNDPRRFGLLTIMDQNGYEDLLQKVAPDPFSDEFNANNILRLRGKSSIKSALIDGMLVSGIGNIYASEILFRASILPHRAVSTLSEEECRRIVDVTRDTLRFAIEVGGSTIRDYRTPAGEEGGFPKHFRVYDRAGRDCYACGHSVSVMKQAGRSTFFCAQCQK